MDLSNRFYHYYSHKFLETQLKKKKSAINRSLLKHGYSNFSLEILEYCEASDVVVREQFYMDLLCPEYNLNKTAGSRLGSIHSEETKTRISKAMKGRTLSEETKAKISEARIGKIHSEETKAIIGAIHTGKIVSSETKVKISEAISEVKGTPLKVLDLETNETSIFSSTAKAGEMIGVTRQALQYYLKKSSSFVLKGRYMIEKIKIDS